MVTVGLSMRPFIQRKDISYLTFHETTYPVTGFYIQDYKYTIYETVYPVTDSI
jgi:hypothetical protein